MTDLRQGDCLDVLRTLDDESVQCCITSPPYWGLRDYGVAGQLGLEPTPDAYIARMTEVFREVWRVLRDDGTLWLNIGDSYAHNGACGGDSPDGARKARRTDADKQREMNYRVPSGLKPKDLCGIPWRLAFALQADGWYLRSDIIWHKPNPMPESVRDRPTKAHEYVFLMSKSERYFWDQEAVREGYSDDRNGASGATYHRYLEATGKSIKATTLHIGNDSPGRNIRSVWTITPKPFKGAHFATFPSALVERCMKAGTSEHGACPHCGRAWERVVERKEGEILTWKQSNGATEKHAGRIQQGLSSAKSGFNKGSKADYYANMPRNETLGFLPACSCPAADPVPCVVLDPFIGSGTVAVVAEQLGRSCIGIDLNPAYLAMAQERVATEQGKMVLFG